MKETERKILNISLPANLYEDVETLAAKDAMTKGELAREAIRRYVGSKKRWQQIREWGDNTASALGILDEKTVMELVHELRREK